jgi:hypothetical protein
VIGWNPRLSIEAERAIRSLNRTRVLISRSRGSAVPATSPGDYRSDLTELGIVRAFSTLDSYLTTRGDVLLHRELPIPTSPSPLESYLHDQLSRRFRGSIDGPIRYWKAALGVDVTEHKRWSEVSAFRELRNLIVHSLGLVRPHGDKLRPALEKRLAAIAADPAKFTGRVPTTDADFDEVAALVEDVVVWVDRARP